MLAPRSAVPYLHRSHLFEIDFGPAGAVIGNGAGVCTHPSHTGAVRTPPSSSLPPLLTSTLLPLPNPSRLCAFALETTEATATTTTTTATPTARQANPRLLPKA